MTKFMALDAGDRTLGDKLEEGFGIGREDAALGWLQDAFNKRLAKLAQASSIKAGV